MFWFECYRFVTTQNTYTNIGDNVFKLCSLMRWSFPEQLYILPHHDFTIAHVIAVADPYNIEDGKVNDSNMDEGRP